MIPIDPFCFVKKHGWAHVEIFGHREHWGHVAEATVAGAAMLVVRVPDGLNADTWRETHGYGGAAIFSLTPCTEQEARTQNVPWDQRMGSAAITSPQLPEHEVDGLDGAPLGGYLDCEHEFDCELIEQVHELHGEQECTENCAQVGVIVGSYEHHWIRKQSMQRAAGDETPEHPAERKNLGEWLQCAHCTAWATLREP